jgi:hypothetical protein
MANMQQNYNDRSSHDASLHDQVLCKLTVDLNGVLEVLPDFSKRGDLPYRITTLEGAIFEYTISHESPPLPKELAAQEQKLLAEMFARKAVSLSLRSGALGGLLVCLEKLRWNLGMGGLRWNFRLGGLRWKPAFSFG